MLVFFFLILAFILFLLQRRIYFRIWRRCLSVSVTFENERTAEGEGNTVIERMENRSVFPVHVIFVKYSLLRSYSPLSDDSGRKEISFKGGIGGRKIKERRYRIDALRRGYYTVSRIDASGRDIFLSAEYENHFYPQSSFFVFPKRIDTLSFDLCYRELLGAVLTKRRRNEDPFELRGIRDYMTSDSMKSVNWKASAKTGDLKVNEHDWTTDEGASIILDLRRGTEDEKETLISYAATAAERFLRRGINTSLVSNARSSRDGSRIRTDRGSGYGHGTAIDESLALIKTTAVTDETPSELISIIETDNTSFLLITRTLESEDECRGYDCVICFDSKVGKSDARIIEIGGEA